MGLNPLTGSSGRPLDIEREIERLKAELEETQEILREKEGEIERVEEQLSKHEGLDTDLEYLLGRLVDIGMSAHEIRPYLTTEGVQVLDTWFQKTPMLGPEQRAGNAFDFYLDVLRRFGMQRNEVE